VQKVLDEWKEYKMGVPTYGAIILDETLENVSCEGLEGRMVYAGRSNLFVVYIFHLEKKKSASDSGRPDSYLTLLYVYRNIIWKTVNTLGSAFLLSFVFLILTCMIP